MDARQNKYEIDGVPQRFILGPLQLKFHFYIIGIQIK